MVFQRIALARAALFVSMSLAVLSPAAAQEIHIVSPNDLEFEEGDSIVDPGCCGPFRYQQVFDASEFASLPAGQFSITQLAQRPDVSVDAPRTTVWDDVQILMSITSAGPDDISNFFEDNIETEQTIVYDGPLTFMTSNTGPANGPKDFDQFYDLQTPYAYNPADGNLLVEWISSSGFTPTSGGDFFSVPITSVFSDDPNGDVGAFFGGVVIQFTFVSDSMVLQPGDADQDLKFDQVDIVRVSQAGKYLTGQPATWGEGDWDGGPGGQPGNPPTGDGFFNQLDIIASLNANKYLTGPYAAVAANGQQGDGQTSIVYDPVSGEIGVDAPAGTELTSINIDSVAGIFTGDPAANLGGSFDNDADGNIFKATFGSSFGSLSFGNVAQAGLTEDFVLNDLSVIGSLAGGGDLGQVDLIYVPEPSGILLVMLAGLGFAGAGTTRQWQPTSHQ